MKKGNGKSKKRAKYEEVNGKGGERRERGCPGPTWDKVNLGQPQLYL